jgi:UDP-glucose 4-epimerase
MKAAGKRALVTGGAGFIGSHVVEALLDGGYDVVVADNLSTGKRKNVPSAARFVECDIATPEFRRLVESERPSVIAHLAAQIDVRRSLEDPIEDAAINIVALVAMMETVAKSVPACRMVLTSTAGVYGDAPNPPLPEATPLSPLSPYAI